MAIKDPQKPYNTTAKTFHWGVGLLIIGMLCVGFFMEGMDFSPLKFKVVTWHKSIGILILTLTVLRLLWRWVSTPPALIRETMKKWETVLALSTHYLLYTCMILMPLSGWAMVSVDDNPDPTIYGFTLPPLLTTESKFWGGFFHSLHFYLAWALIGLITLHVLGALKHHFIHKDNTLRRMLPFARLK